MSFEGCISLHRTHQTTSEQGPECLVTAGAISASAACPTVSWPCGWSRHSHMKLPGPHHALEQKLPIITAGSCSGVTGLWPYLERGSYLGGGRGP